MRWQPVCYLVIIVVCHELFSCCMYPLFFFFVSICCMKQSVLKHIVQTANVNFSRQRSNLVNDLLATFQELFHPREKRTKIFSILCFYLLSLTEKVFFLQFFKNFSQNKKTCNSGVEVQKWYIRILVPFHSITT